ncbi:MAG TPA: hypothetical protein VJ928_09655 [Marivita sp.]|nr:hypothetical protein [Marivita sp.]
MKKMSKTVFCVIFSSVFAMLIYEIWFGWTWPARLEAAATTTINRPIQKHNFVELHGRTIQSAVFIDIVMSAPVTVIVPVSSTDPQLIAIRAATGVVCEEPSAFAKYVFVELGLFDHCLIREKTDKPSEALVLRLIRDHHLESRWNGWIHYAWDHPGKFGHDEAWQFDLSERIDGQETLLGRAIATEFKSEDAGKELPKFWPAIPELEQRKAALRERSATIHAKGPAQGKERWSFGAQGWYDPLHDTPSNLSYALLERALGVKMDLSWLDTASPHPLRAMDYAEKLLFSDKHLESNHGENLLYSILRPAACFGTPSCEAPRDALSVAVQDRALEIAIRVLDGFGSDQGPDISMIHRFMIPLLPHEHASKLLHKTFETALLNGFATETTFFHLLLDRFEDAPKPLLSDQLCSTHLKQLRETELKYAEGFVLCR